MTTYTEMQTKFLARVERFMRRHDIAPSRLGRDALKDPTFVFDLRAGQVLRPETMDRVELYMRNYTKSDASPEAVHAAE